jgi:hypothetical protein
MERQKDSRRISNQDAFLGIKKCPTMVLNSSEKRAPNSGPVLWAAITSAIQSWVSKNDTNFSQKVPFLKPLAAGKFPSSEGYSCCLAMVQLDTAKNA